MIEPKVERDLPS